MHLFELPIEILLQIITDKLLCANDLYYLATLSRLLHSIALPVYLRIHKIHDPMTYSAIHIGKKLSHPTTPLPDAISGLAISTNLIAIDHLVCYFHGFRASETAFQIMESRVQQLCRVINRLKRVSKFRLCLFGTMSPQSGRRVSDNDLKIWTTSISDLLNAVVAKRCLDITVQAGCWSEDPYHFRTVNPSKNPLATVRHLAKSVFSDSLAPETFLRGLDWKFFRPTTERNHSKSMIMCSLPPLLAISSLRSFAIQSRIFLIPPYLSWTISVLSIGANITSLAFRITQLKPCIWKIVLQRIAEVMSNRLREIYFQPGCYGLDFSDLLAFLTQTPNLTHLEVHNSCKVTIPGPCTRESLLHHHCPFTVPALPNLQFLTTPLSIASHLVSMHRGYRRLSLPSLREWEVFVEADKLFGDYSYAETSCQRLKEICE